MFFLYCCDRYIPRGPFLDGKRLVSLSGKTQLNFADVTSSLTYCNAMRQGSLELLVKVIAGSDLLPCDELLMSRIMCGGKAGNATSSDPYVTIHVGENKPKLPELGRTENI